MADASAAGADDEGTGPGEASGFDEGGESAALRACAFCGTPIHPRSHRCPHCGGHVGLAWGSVHKEYMLFLFLAIVTLVGCLAPWTGRTPVLKRTVVETPAPPPAPGAAPGAMRPAAPPEVKVEVTQEVARMGGPRNGLDTTRGVFIFAIALYGVVAMLLNLLYRRSVMWPAALNGFLCLWVGLQGVFTSMSSDAWGHWKTWAEPKNFIEQMFAGTRAIPPGLLLIAFVGVLTVFRLVAGVLAAASKGKPQPEARESAAARRRRTRGTDGATEGGDVAGGDAAP